MMPQCTPPQIYAVPYASSYVLEIDPERRAVTPFAMVGSGWGKWAGGVLALDGRIYAIPALETSVLEIDVEHRATARHGMLPNRGTLSDKWNGGVVAPDGKVYGIPWRSSSVLEFDPDTKAVALRGDSLPTNFTWHGGVLTPLGTIVALPYNSKAVLELGVPVCAPESGPLAFGRHEPAASADVLATGTAIGGVGLLGGGASAAEPARSGHALAPAPHSLGGPSPPKFVLSMSGCPDGDATAETACFHVAHRQWHSILITVGETGFTTLYDLRSKAALSGMTQLPTNFCFLFNGHPLDPSAEANIRAVEVAFVYAEHYVVLIDNTRCNLDAYHAPLISPSMVFKSAPFLLLALAGLVWLVVACRRRAKNSGYRALVGHFEGVEARQIGAREPKKVTVPAPFQLCFSRQTRARSQVGRVHRGGGGKTPADKPAAEDSAQIACALGDDERDELLSPA